MMTSLSQSVHPEVIDVKILRLLKANITVQRFFSVLYLKRMYAFHALTIMFQNIVVVIDLSLLKSVEASPVLSICFTALGSCCALDELCLPKGLGAGILVKGHTMVTGTKVFRGKASWETTGSLQVCPQTTGCQPLWMMGSLSLLLPCAVMLTAELS